MSARSRETPANPPLIKEHHVRLPDEAARILGATSAHRRGFTGRGVRIAVIDSGFYLHPFYLSRGYDINLIPTRREPSPDIDEYGHGTAQLASLFAIAPHAEVLAIKCRERDPSYAVAKAIALKPHVLSLAWGFNIDHPRAREIPAAYKRLHRLIKEAVKKGICVVAAAGNGQRAFPGNMPEVISCGGVYYTPEGQFQPSDVSSSFESSMFPKRMVPDICGLVGNLPHGRLLLVPVPPSARLARRSSFNIADHPPDHVAGAAIPAGEVRALKIRGWAMFSGTSAATAMTSGAAALLLQARPDLTPEAIKVLLVENSQQVPVSGCRVLSVDRSLNAANADKCS